MRLINVAIEQTIQKMQRLKIRTTLLHMHPWAISLISLVYCCLRSTVGQLGDFAHLGWLEWPCLDLAVFAWSLVLQWACPGLLLCWKQLSFMPGKWRSTSALALEAGAQNLDIVTSAAFCWSKEVTKPAQIQGADTWKHQKHIVKLVGVQLCPPHVMFWGWLSPGIKGMNGSAGWRVLKRRE